MECDELMEQMLQDEPVVTDQHTDKHRERLAALVAGGKCSQYLGENYTTEKIDNMTDEEIELYVCYESRLGATMTKTIGSAMLQLYTVVAGTFLPIPTENRIYLCKSLEKDPFIEHAISAVSCEFYHRYGMFLAPLTTALITARYCQFKHMCPLTKSGDGGTTRERGNTIPDCTNDRGNTTNTNCSTSQSD